MSRPSDTPSRHIVVAVSGGLDSSVTLALLAQADHPLTAVHLVLHETDTPDTEALRALCRRFETPFETVDLRARFEQCVVEPFVRAYSRGRTPNPCVLCNPAIKLGALLEWAHENGADAVATGHYARVEHNPRSGRHELRRGADAVKDQSYYLSRLGQDQLAHFLAPLGAMTKDQVREIALHENIDAVDRPESQEVCFVPDDDYRAFVEERLGARAPKPGPIVDAHTGAVLGRHQGVHRYTIGQRRGLGISAPEPLYVVALRPADRAVVVAPASELMSQTMRVAHIERTDDAPLPEFCRVQVRYRSSAEPAQIEYSPEETIVRFVHPQRAITPGQTAAFYDETDERVLGAGEILALDDGNQ